MVGRRITAAIAHRSDLRAPLPPKLAEIKGARVTAITRRAKYILMALDNDETLLLHLGMSGRILVAHHATELGKHDHIVISLDNGATVTFNDPRRFGFCDLVDTAKLAEHKSLRDLGVEPLDKALTAVRFAALFDTRSGPIKTVLMDQKLIVGIGNIYACEALFDASISPLRPAKSLSKPEYTRLHESVRKVLKEAIAAGGSSLRDYRQADGELGYFQHHFAVYGKEGERCKGCDCDIAKTGGIRRMTQAGRSTFFCATKQT